jgi:hypothetical protein
VKTPTNDSDREIYEVLEFYLKAAKRADKLVQSKARTSIRASRSSSPRDLPPRAPRTTQQRRGVS